LQQRKSGVLNEEIRSKRQRAAIAAHAKAANYTIVAEYSDDGVSGADAITSRPGFSALLSHIAGNGVRVVIVETASRLARDLMVQETAYRGLLDLGVKLIAADSPDTFVDDGPTATMVRQILGAVSQFEKAGLVAKLKAARIVRGQRPGNVEAERLMQSVTLQWSPWLGH
jgi:DNA invertase Pin-like site-specific DNA recombinase